MRSYARPYRWQLTVFVVAAALSAVITVAIPVLLGGRDRPRRPAAADERRCSGSQGLVAGLSIFDAALNFIQRWYTARVGEGLIFDLRTRVFSHVQRIPVAFFTRTQTGALVSRLNSDVIGAQQAFTSTICRGVSNVIGADRVLATMLTLSWQVTLLVADAAAAVPAARPGWSGEAAGVIRERYTQRRDGHATTERFNVSGALAGQPVRAVAGRRLAVPGAGRPGP